MRNPFIPIILFILSSASYFAFIAPFWEDVGVIKSKQETAQNTIVRGEELKTLVADISDKVKRFEEEDPSGRLGAILPVETDELLFLNDLSALVGNQGLEAKELVLDDASNEGGSSSQTAEDGTLAAPARTTGHVSRTVSFSVSATYPQFVSLLREIEQNLVLLEIESIDFMAGADGQGSSGEASRGVSRSSGLPTVDYSITLRTISVR